MNDFDQAASGFQAFLKQKEKLAGELSEIIGFDINLLKEIKPREPKSWRDFKIDYKYLEQTYSGYGQGQPIYFGMAVQLKGALSLLTLSTIENPVLIAFKENDQWCVTGGNFKAPDPQPISTIRKAFHSRLESIGCKIEDYLQPAANPEPRKPQP